ncbi:MAG: hypothetical protein DA407_01955 [Bacteroidetes bacterium]|nr:MAG: hypothetical protein DA407_01955 [Bacteroidota bacterium]
MKNFIFSIVLLFCFTSINSQESEINTVLLKLGEKVEQNGITIKFDDVITDSRCPKGVTCVWAGEVVVLVTIYNDGKKSEQKKLTLSPTSQLQDLTGNLYITDTLKLTAINVFPYPDTKSKIDKKEYGLKVQIN